MSSHESNRNKAIAYLKDIFIAHLSHQDELYNYPRFFLSIRSELVKWIIKICQKLRFKKETLYRTISIFDRYVSSSKESSTSNDMSKCKLIIITCLSIATKVNEVNANYLKFFTKNILNFHSNIQYTSSDVYMKECEILSKINYCINSSNICQFNSIFEKICLMFFKNNRSKQKFISINDSMLKEYISSPQSIEISPVNGAMKIVNMALNSFKENDVGKAEVIAAIENLTNTNKCIL